MTTRSQRRAGSGIVRRALYCDESGIAGDHKFYGFGALIMGYQRRGEFSAVVAGLKKKHRAPEGEIKWSKCTEKTFPFYSGLVDYFFEEPSMFFHAMVVERAWVDTKLYHGGSFDLARRKHFTQFLSNKIARMKTVHRGRQLEARVYVDRLPSSYCCRAGCLMAIRAGWVMGIAGDARRGSPKTMAIA